MKKYLNYLWGLAFTKTAKSTYITSIGAGINAILGFIFTIVIARSIPPSDFGLFSVVMNFITILFVICDAGLSSSILRFLPQAIRDGKKDEIGKIIKLSFFSSLLISSLLVFLLVIFSSPIASTIFMKKELIVPILVSSFSLIGLSCYSLFVAILQGQQRFVFGVITESSVLALKTLVTIVFLLLGKLNLISVLLIFSTTTFVGIILGFLFIGPKFLFAKTDFSLAKILFGFGLWVVLARIANATSSRIDTLMLVRFVDAAQVGFYAAAQRMTFPFPVMVTGMTVVFSPKFAALKEKKEAISFMKKSSLFLSVLFLPVIVLFFLAPDITVWIYGPSYQVSADIFRWLLLSSVFFIVSTVPVTLIIYYLGDSRFFAMISLLQLVLIFLGNFLLIPRFGVIGPAISLAIAYGIVFIISLIFVWKKFK